MLVVTSRKEISFVARLVANGFIFIVLLILTIIGFGIFALSETQFKLESYRFKPDLDSTVRPLVLMSPYFPSLTGVLCVGLYLHPFAVPIIKLNENQKNNPRDLFLSYVIAIFIVVLVGVFGYFGFQSSYFNSYYQLNQNHEISSNALNMFDSTDPIGFSLRILLYLFLCCTFPIVLHLQKQMIAILIWGPDTEIEQLPKKKFLIMNFCAMLSPLGFALFYPNVGSILSWVGTIAGVVMVYFLPFFVYKEFLKQENQNFGI